MLKEYYKRYTRKEEHDTMITFINCSKRNEYLFPNNAFWKRQLNAKILRSYMSFLKEIYTATYLWNSQINAIYSLDNDKKGYDIFVNHNDYEYGIKIYSKTPNAERFRTEKRNNRNVKISKHMSTIELPIFLQEKIGDTYVPTRVQLNNIVQYIKEHSVGYYIVDYY